MYATPSPGAKFSDNLLTGGATLAPDGARVFHLTPGAGCSYDLRVVFGDKQSREKKARATFAKSPTFRCNDPAM